MNKHTWYTYSRRAYHALSILIILAMMLAPTIRVNAILILTSRNILPAQLSPSQGIIRMQTPNTIFRHRSL